MRNLKLDNKCQALLDDLKRDFDISFKTWNKNFREVYSKQNKAIIYYNKRKSSNESIAHELLHIWLKKYNCLSSNHLYLTFQSHSFLSRIFDKRLCDHIGNCMDHYKMYPKYISMGYQPEKFIAGDGKEQCSLLDIQQISFKANGQFNVAGINRFFGYLISIYADHVANDYSRHLILLQQFDDELFQTVTDFWKKWEEFDIENIDVLFNSDFQLWENLISAIEDWTTENIYTA